MLYRGGELPSGALHAGDQHRAGVVELVDAPDSKSGSERSVGSIPTTRTTFNLKVNRRPKSSNLTRLADVDEDANYLFQIPAAIPKNPPPQRKRDRERAERIRLAGGLGLSLREKAYAFARQRTIVKTCDFTAIGIPRHYLAWMCEEGLLVREGYGLYRAAGREAA